MAASRSAVVLATMLAATPAHADKRRTAADVSTLFVVSASALQAETEHPRVELVPLFCSTGPGTLATGQACIKPIPAKTKVRLGDGREVKTSSWRRSWVCWEKEMLEERPRRTAMLLQVAGLKPGLESSKPIAVAIWPARSPAYVPRSQTPSPPQSPSLAKLVDSRDVIQDLSIDLDSDGTPERVVSVADGKLRLEHGGKGPLVLLTQGNGTTVEFAMAMRVDGGASLRIEVLSVSDLDADGKLELVVYAYAAGENDVLAFEYGSTEPLVSHRCSFL